MTSISARNIFLSLSWLSSLEGQLFGYEFDLYHSLLVFITLSITLLWPSPRLICFTWKRSLGEDKSHGFGFVSLKLLTCIHIIKHFFFINIFIHKTLVLHKVTCFLIKKQILLSKIWTWFSNRRLRASMSEMLPWAVASCIIASIWYLTSKEHIIKWDGWSYLNFMLLDIKHLLAYRHNFFYICFFLLIHLIIN